MAPRPEGQFDRRRIVLNTASVAARERLTAMRRKAVLLLALALAGCYPDQGSDIASCEAQARRFFHLYKAADPNDPSSQYLIECMAAKGYAFTVAPSDCDSKQVLPTQAACYVPENWLAGLYDALRRRLKMN